MTSPSKLAQWVAARQMAFAGYATRIILIETGLTHKQVRRLYRELEEEGHKLVRKSRTLRTGATIISSQTAKIQASLLMTLYWTIGGEGVLRSINIEALTKAFRLYHAIRKEVPGMRGGRWLPFDITDAWCLAQELRSDQAMLEQCHSCECIFFTSINQRTLTYCPYCKDNTRPTAEAEEREEELQIA